VCFAGFPKALTLGEVVITTESCNLSGAVPTQKCVAIGLSFEGHTYMLSGFQNRVVGEFANLIVRCTVQELDLYLTRVGESGRRTGVCVFLISLGADQFGMLLAAGLFGDPLADVIVRLFHHPLKCQRCRASRQYEIPTHSPQTYHRPVQPRRAATQKCLRRPSIRSENRNVLP
jgi:hypothetical protein